jgi:hypothetical protein
LALHRTQQADRDCAPVLLPKSEAADNAGKPRDASQYKKHSLPTIRDYQMCHAVAGENACEIAKTINQT